MNIRKVGVLILSVFMLIGSSTSSYAATDLEVSSGNNEEFKDVANHWGASAINKWSDFGVINGYNGLFRPNGFITRGELAVVLDNIMDYQVVAENIFSDLMVGEFYTEAILKANAAGIIQGSGTKVRPTDEVTREEAVVMLGKAFAVDESTGGLSTFSDLATIATWAKDYVSSMQVKGYLNGTNNTFLPKTSMTRAEVVTIIDNIVKAYYTYAGTYSENVNGTAIIKVSGVSLKGVTISENLIVAEGVGQGEVILDSVTVGGNTLVRGGGENSVHILGTSSITAIRIEKAEGKLRIHITDGNTVKEITVAEGEEINIEGTVGTLDVNAENSTVYAITANISKANITGKNSTIIMDSKSEIETVTVSSTGDNANIQTQAGSKIGTITAEASVAASGNGKVTNVDLNAGADGSSITTPNTTIKVNDGVIGVTRGGGKSVAAGTTGTNYNVWNNVIVKATGGGTSVSSTIQVSAITVMPTTLNLTVGGATGTLVETISPSNATNKTVTWSSSDEGIATVTDGVVTPVAAGTTNVSVTSIANSSITATCVITVENMLQATTPSAMNLVVGSSNPVGNVTNVVIPVAGGTDTTGAVQNWSYMNGDRIKFSVTDSESASSSIQINSLAYTNGSDYVIASNIDELTVVVTTTEVGKTSVSRTFIISVTENPDKATTPSAMNLAVGSSNPVGGVTNVAMPVAGGADSTGQVTGWDITNNTIKFTITDDGTATSLIQINGSNYTSGVDYSIPSTSSLTIVVVTLETGKATVLRTYIITVSP